MANSFGSTCKALWKFESGALTTDSHSTNTLTDVNTVGTSTLDYKEGSACADFEVNNSEYFSINDSSLSTGFPLKNGDTEKKFSACFWYKAESFPGTGQGLLAKWTGTASTRCFFIGNWSGGELKIYWATGPSSFDTLSPGYTMVTGRWYHIGLVMDGNAKTCYLRVWDDTAATVVVSINLSPSAALQVSNAIFTVGATGDPAPIDGLMDEVVIFNTILTASDIDQIRAGTFTTPPYTIIAEGGLGISGDTTVDTVSPDTYSLISSGGFELSADNSYDLSYLDIYNVESEDGFGLGGDTTVEITTPDTFIVTDQIFYDTGSIEFGGDASTYAFSIDKYSVEASGGIELYSDPLAVTFYKPAPLLIEASGGFGLQSSGQVVFSDYVKLYSLEATGGFFLSSDRNYELVAPTTYSLEAKGGIGISGESIIEIITPSVYALTGSDGFGLGGSTTLVFSLPDKTLSVTASGGFDVNSDSAIAFIHPAILSIIASSGWYLGAESTVAGLEEQYHTWSIIGDGFDASMYSGWNFNSYAIFQGASYAAAPDGIYLIEGDYDAGEEIHSGIRIGPTNMGIHNPKRVRSVKVNDLNAEIRVSNGSDETSSLHDNYKAPISREVQGDELIIDIADFTKISHLEITPLILARR